MSGMPLPLRDTVVSFPGGGLTERSVVEFVDVHGENLAVMTGRTPFHPLDPRWPDQGADRGALVADGRSLPVLDCVVGATDGSSLFVGDAVPVRRGEPGWAFVVVHLLASSGDIAEGAEVQLTVDPGHRAALSAGHTGCHLAALALNAALAHRWRKPARTDGLGHPDFDQLAIVSSRIEPFGAVDTYRVGRSLRKKGFDGQGLAQAMPDLVDDANSRLAAWVAAGVPIEVRVSGPGLTDLREWVCALPEGTQQIPCGGTHLRSLAEVDAVSVALEFDEEPGELVMRTAVR
jgi:alanyl-tRNA synthetase